MRRVQITKEQFDKLVIENNYKHIYGRTLSGLRWEEWGRYYKHEKHLVLEQMNNQPETYWRLTYE